VRERGWEKVEMGARFEDGSRRSSRCKPGDRNFGGVEMAARKRASGVQECSDRRRFRSTVSKGRGAARVQLWGLCGALTSSVIMTSRVMRHTSDHAVDAHRVESFISSLSPQQSPPLSPSL
jgi:hypothetical protein